MSIPIKPINGELVGQLNEYNQHTLFLMAVKINELVQEVNTLKRQQETKPTGEGENNATI